MKGKADLKNSGQFFASPNRFHRKQLLGVPVKSLIKLLKFLLFFLFEL